MHINIDRVFTTVSRNLGLEDFTRYTNSWIEWAYEAEKLIGSVDTFIQKEVTYDATGAKASGTITFAANPTSGDSITLNGVDIFFKNDTNYGEAEGLNESKIGDTLVETITHVTTPYGLIQRLDGIVNSNVSIRNYSPTLHYPEALNVADYSLNATTTGDDLVTNGDFSTSGSWSGTSGVIDDESGKVTIDSSGNFADIRTNVTYVAGQAYIVTFRAKGSAAHKIRVQDETSNLGGLTAQQTNMVLTTSYQEYSFIWIANASSDKIAFSRNDTTQVSWYFNIDDVVVKKAEHVILNVTAKEIGHDGNDYTLSSDNANAKVSGLTLTGGKGIYRNQQIILPEDNLKLLGVRVGTDDSTYEHASIKKTSAVHRGRVGKNSNDSQQRAFRYYIDGNRLNITHDDIDEITINYLAYPTDVRGWPMIKEGHETAVAQYIMWQMKLIDFYNGKLPQYITKELEKRWYQLCGKARGDDSMPTSEELKQIGNMWNTLVPITNDRSSLIDF
tara:strand:- start:3789 stop:5294 length:1506 start_codon:yes stop_codon:yes gene_type:complete